MIRMHRPHSAPPLSWMASLRWPIIEKALRAESQASTVVEIGCGQGAVGARLAAHFAGYVGIEPDARSAEVAAGRVAEHGGVVHDSLDRFEGTGQAGVLCAFEVLEHIDDDLGSLRSWLTYTSPGALVVVSVPADPERFGETDRLVGHFRRYTDAGLTDLLRGAGLTSIRVRRYGYPLGYVLEDVRNRVLARRGVAVDDEVSMDERSHGSGRLLQPQRPWEGTVRSVLTAPFRVWQDARPTSGPGLLATARVPA